MERFENIGQNIMIADKFFKLYLRDALHPYGLNAADGIILMMLYQSEMTHEKADISKTPEGKMAPEGTAAETAAVFHGSTQEDLIRRIHYDKGVMTRTMKELEQKNLVVRKPNPTDSRSYLFLLTSEGREFKATMLEILRTWNDRLLHGIDEEDLKAAQRALSLMSKNASQCYYEETSHAK